MEISNYPQMDSPKDWALVDKLLNGLYVIIETICKLLLFVMVSVIAYTVFMRYVLNNTPTWGEGLSTFLMVWLALLGSSLAVRDGRHIRMTIIEYVIPKKAAKILHMTLHLLILLVGMVWIIDGLSLYDLFTMSIIGALGISSKWQALALPVSGTAVLIMLIARFRRGKW